MALVDAIGIGIGLAILGVPLVIPLAALVFLGAFIPIIGSFLAGIGRRPGRPGGQGADHRADRARRSSSLVMQLEGHVLQPLLLGRAVRVHPLAVVLSIAAGLLIGGIFGALIAVPDGGLRQRGRHLPQPAARRAAATRTARPTGPDRRSAPAEGDTQPGTLIRPSTGGQRDVGAPVRAGQPDRRDPLVGGLPGGGQVGADRGHGQHPAAGGDHRAVGGRRAVPACSTPSPSAPVIASPVRGASGIARGARRRRSPRRRPASAAAGARPACRSRPRAAARPAASPAAPARPGSPGRRTGR